ncbi:hypothetical protein [Vineibacter terrae]|nr:hypothetical protein [Vineibacter terrae]HEX2886032.1 hypothetical protein [Vineibacter terrae]
MKVDIGAPGQLAGIMAAGGAAAKEGVTIMMVGPRRSSGALSP